MEQAIESLLPSLATADLAARRYRTIPRLSRLRRREMAPFKSNNKPCGASNHSPAKDCMILALVSGLNSAFSGLARCGRRFPLLPFTTSSLQLPSVSLHLHAYTGDTGGWEASHRAFCYGLPNGPTVRPSNQEISWEFAPRRGSPSVIPAVSMAPPKTTKLSVHCTTYEGGKKSLRIKSKISWASDLK